MKRFLTTILLILFLAGSALAQPDSGLGITGGWRPSNVPTVNIGVPPVQTPPAPTNIWSGMFGHSGMSDLVYIQNILSGAAGQSLSVTDSPTFVNITLSGLTASSLVATDAAKKFTSAALGVSLTFGSSTLNTIQNIRTTDSPTFAGLTLTAFSGVVKATAGVLSAAALADNDIPDTITLTNITQITNRSHTSLSSIGTLTHATIDTYLDQAVKQASSPTFAGLALGAGNFTLTGSIGATAARSTKGWFTNLEITNSPTVNGTALSSIYQPLHANLTSLAALSFASTSFVKMTAANTFALDTATYLTSFTETDPVVKALTGIIKSDGSTIGTVTIGSSLTYASPPTLDTIQDIRTTASPTLAGLIIKNGATVKEHIFNTTPTGASVNTDTGYMFGETIPAGLVTEVSGEILTYGINVPQVGTRDDARVGGLFRLDTRAGYQHFIVSGYATGGAVEAERFTINLQTGLVNVKTVSALGLIDTNASHYLRLNAGSDLSADRILTFTTGDAARTITLSGDPTLADWFDQAVKQASSPTLAGLTLTAFSGFVKATAGVLSAAALADGDIPNDITLTNITQITNRSHTSLSDIGTLTHANIDSYLDQSVKQAATPTFGGIVIANGGTIGQAAGPLLTFNDTDNYLGITGANVGIGITTPVAGLHITRSVNAGFEALRLENTSIADTDKQIFMTFHGYDSAYGNKEVGKISIIPSGVNWLAARMTFSVLEPMTYGVIERMRIDDNGNIGIGTTAPSSKLHLYESTAANLDAKIEVSSTAQNSSLTLKSAATYTILSTGSGSSHGGSKFILTDGTNIGYAMSGGNVGIGTANPYDSLQIVSTGLSFSTTDNVNRWRMVQNTGQDLLQLGYWNGAWYPTPGTASVNFKFTGEVGIGTTAPLAKLAINGGLHVGGDSDPGDNNLLVDGTAEVTGDIFTTAWTNYSATSTVTGWAAGKTVLIWYKKVGKLVFVQFDIFGTSDNVVATFTLPYSMVNSVDAKFAIQSVNLGVTDAAAGLGQILQGTPGTVVCYRTWAGLAFTNSGTKQIVGQFWYHTA